MCDIITIERNDFGSVISLANIELVKFWEESSDDDYRVMKDLQEKKHNAWALFLGHLVIEKLAKSLYAKTHTNQPHTPKTHNIIVLLERSNIDMNSEPDKRDKLLTINTFNIGGRYDTYKKEFNKKATDNYTAEQIKNIEEIREWLKQLLM